MSPRTPNMVPNFDLETFLREGQDRLRTTPAETKVLRRGFGVLVFPFSWSVGFVLTPKVFALGPLRFVYCVEKEEPT